MSGNPPAFLEEVPKEHHLRHVDTDDKSKPVVDPGKITYCMMQSASTQSFQAKGNICSAPAHYR